MLLAVLYAFCLAVGFLTGATGVGGVLVPPALVLLSGLETHTAMGTSLAAMFFLTLLGTWMFWRLGLIRWREALPLCSAAVWRAGPAPGATPVWTPGR